MNKKLGFYLKLVITALFCIILIFEISQRKSPSKSCDNTSIANPAAVYCKSMGYEYKIVSTDKGQEGICEFPDGSMCREWEFYSGKCGKDFSYCVKEGYGIKTLNDGKDPYSQEYAVCITGAGDTEKIVGSVVELSGIKSSVDGCQNN